MLNSICIDESHIYALFNIKVSFIQYCMLYLILFIFLVLSLLYFLFQVKLKLIQHLLHNYYQPIHIHKHMDGINN